MSGVGATVLDGKATRDEIFVDLTERVGKLSEAGRTPGLGTILVGDDPGSQTYVRGKHADCAKVGINSIRRDLPADITQAKLDETIDELNANPECTGYIVQLPLPKHLNENAALERVDPGKDADGLHPTNLGRLVLNEPAPLPCTPRGNGAGVPSTSLPRLVGCSPSASLPGSTRSSAAFWSRCLGSGSCTM